MKKLILNLGFIAITSFSATSQTINWIKTEHLSDETVGMSVHLDVFENVYVGGYFASSSHGSGPNGVFLSKYDKNGTLLWSDSTCSPVLTLEGKVTDKTGNSYLFVNSGSDAQFGSINISYIAPYYNSLIIKYNSSGQVLWAKQLLQSSAKNIVLDDMGNIYISGECYDSLNFGSSITVASGMYLAKYDNNGNVLWAKHTGAAPGSNCLTYVPSGIISLGSKVGGAYVIDKYTTSGNFLSSWNPGIPGGVALSADRHGNLYFTGTFYYNITLGSTTLTDSGQAMFVAKVNSLNQFVWARKVNSNNFLTSFPDSAGNVFVSASYGSYHNGGITTIKYDSLGGLQWSLNHPSNGSNGWIYSDGKGNIVSTSWTYAPMSGTEMLVFKIADNLGTTNINEHKSNNEMSVYPNPTPGVLLVSFTSSSGNAKINVIDSKGVQVSTYSVNSFGEVFQKEIDLSKQSKGVYFIEIITDEKRMIKRVILN